LKNDANMWKDEQSLTSINLIDNKVIKLIQVYNNIGFI